MNIDKTNSEIPVLLFEPPDLTAVKRLLEEGEAVYDSMPEEFKEDVERQRKAFMEMHQPIELKLVEGDVSKLQLQPGDRLVIKVDAILNDEIIDRLSSRVKQWAGDIPVMVLDAGTSLYVISRG